MVSRILAPDSYKIYFVGDMDRRTATQKIALAFDTCGLTEFGGVPLEVVKRNDEGEPSHARQLAENISREPDTLLVVGHIASAQTEAALPVYLNAHPPIPVYLDHRNDSKFGPADSNGNVYAGAAYVAD